MTAVTMDFLQAGDLARFDETTALRRAYDTHNLRRLRQLLTLFAAVSLGEIAYALSANGATRWHLALAIANLLLVIYTGALGDALGGGRRFHVRAVVGPARTIERHLRAWTLGYFALQFLLFVVFARDVGWGIWGILFPLLICGVRAFPSELMLLHGFISASSIVKGMLFHGSSRSIVPMCVMVLIVNISATVYSIIATRTFRNAFLPRWRVDHANYREATRMRDELTYARDMQLSMLPDAPPDVGWLDIAAVSLPATEVGGDYYDYFRVGERNLAVVSGDVAGHGLASGIVLASIRTGCTLLRDALHDPVGVLTRLDELIRITSRRRMLVAFAIVLFDEARRTATIASAGHPPVLVRRSDGTTESVECFAPPIGVRLPRNNETRTIGLAPDDVLVLHTDGIFEALGAREEPYGLERLTRTLANATGDAAAIRDALVNDVAAFRGGAPQSDDVTVVVVRVR